MIAIDLSKQEVLDANTKAIQQINFRGNLDRTGCKIMFFIFEEVKELILNLPLKIVRVLWNLFCFNIILIQKWFNITA